MGTALELRVTRSPEFRPLFGVCHSVDDHHIPFDFVDDPVLELLQWAAAHGITDDLVLQSCFFELFEPLAHSTSRSPRPLFAHRAQ